jgi:hypothetical protein
MTQMSLRGSTFLFATVAFFIALGCSSSASPSSAESSASMPDAAADAGSTCDFTFGSARYEIDFEATWSAATHPMAFVADAHLTPLTGGSHNANLVVWRVGGIASRGVQAVAETGDPHLLSLELDAAFNAGTAWGKVSGSGISPPPGTDKTIVELDTAHPFVSLEAMLAPSPDWFTGVDSLGLCSSIGWTYGVNVDARVYDAGTKSGEMLDYSGSPTKDPIKLRDFGIFADNNVIGTFHFVRKL